jgi:hypothetical protein
LFSNFLLFPNEFAQADGRAALPKDIQRVSKKQSQPTASRRLAASFLARTDLLATNRFFSR